MDVAIDPAKMGLFQSRVPSLDPWMHHFKFADDCYTGIYPAEGLHRDVTSCTRASPSETVDAFRRAYGLMDHDAKRRFFSDIVGAMDIDPANATVLDIASATGKYSLWSVEHGFGRVISSEIRKHQCDQEALILECAADPRYLQAITVNNDPESADRPEYAARYNGQGIDVVLSFGLLYHVANPLQHLLNCAAITRKYAVVYTRTRISASDENSWSLKAEDPDWVTLAVEGVSWVPHFHFLTANARKCGFRRCRILYPDVFARNFPDYDRYGRLQRTKIGWSDRLHRRFGIDLGFMRNAYPYDRYYAGMEGTFFAYLLEK